LNLRAFFYITAIKNCYLFAYACYAVMSMLTKSVYEAVKAHPYIAAVTSVAIFGMIDARCSFRYSTGILEACSLLDRGGSDARAL
jgi:hypothetical protein